MRRALSLVLVLGCTAPAAARQAPAPAAAVDTIARVAAPHPLDSATFAAYVGQYAAPDAPDLVLSIYADEGHFWMQPTDNPRFELVRVGADSFDVPRIQHRITFRRGAGGAVTGVVVRSPNGAEHPVAPKISDRPLIVRFTAMTRTDTMIPMRDGTRLHTIIVVPAAPAGPLPIMLERTPYGVGGGRTVSELKDALRARRSAKASPRHGGRRDYAQRTACGK